MSVNDISVYTRYIGYCVAQACYNYGIFMDFFNLKDFIFFDISFQTMNLFSFVMGMFYASTISWFGRKALIQVIIYFMVLAAWYAAGAWIERTKLGNSVVYDCRIAEISPDFPIKARQQCRDLMTKENK